MGELEFTSFPIVYVFQEIFNYLVRKTAFINNGNLIHLHSLVRIQKQVHNVLNTSVPLLSIAQAVFKFSKGNKRVVVTEIPFFQRIHYFSLKEFAFC